MAREHNVYSRVLAWIGEAVRAEARAAGDATEPDLERIVVEPPRDTFHGNFATNAALVLAGRLGEPPEAVAGRLVERLGGLPQVARCEAAGPGFLNLTLSNRFWQAHLREIVRIGDAYGRSDAGAEPPVAVETVLAGPAGPVPFDLCRPVVVGDVLANLLEAAGHPVTREIYVEDDGSGGRATESRMEAVRADLAALGATLGLPPDGVVREPGPEHPDRLAAAIDRLDDLRLVIRDAAGGTLLRLPNCGEDVDRALIDPAGRATGFAARIARAYDKFTRGCARLVVVEGAGGGCVKSLRPALSAMTGSRDFLRDVPCRSVLLRRDGEPVSMPGRAGEPATFARVLEEVGADAARFAMLTRKADAALPFDLARIAEQSRGNPVFHVQYAHARCRSVFRRAAAEPGLADPDPERLAGADFARLEDPGELALIRRISAWPGLVASAAWSCEPHRIACCLNDLAGAFHEHWNRGKESPSLLFIHPDDTELSMARMALVHAIRLVIASGLAILGVTAPEEMR